MPLPFVYPRYLIFMFSFINNFQISMIYVIITPGHYLLLALNNINTIYMILTLHKCLQLFDHCGSLENNLKVLQVNITCQAEIKRLCAILRPPLPVTKD